MGASATNAAPLRAVRPKGAGQFRMYALRMAGGTTGAGTVQADESSAGFVFDGDSGTTGEYTFTLPGKGGCTIGPVLVSLEGPDTDKDAYVQSRTESTRKITIEVKNQATAHAAANLDADEYLNILVFVADV